MGVYAFIFGREFFINWNKLLFNLSIRGLGILNYSSFRLSGEKHFLELVTPYLGGVVFDVGANVGGYTKSFVNRSDLQIYSFEPHPINFQRLSAEFSERRNVTLINSAVSDRNGELELFDYSEKNGSSHASLYRDVIEEVHKQKSVSQKVNVITLSDFCKENEIEHVGLLKIDTEGNELKVLIGFKDFIDKGKVPLIQFEFNEMNIESRVYMKDFYKLLSDYLFFRLLPSGMLRLDNYSSVNYELFGFQNIIAIHREHELLKKL